MQRHHKHVQEIWLSESKLATVTPSQHPAVTQMHHTPNYKYVIKMHLIKRGD